MSKELWAEVKPLLDEALDLEPEARGAWLEGLRRRAPAMAEEVAALLAAGPDDLEQLFSPAGGGDLLDRDLAGQAIGGYTLDRLVGRGGMGTVWLAHRSDGRFEGRAAVKLMNLALVTPAGRERFRREGTALARLAHPGIARLLDAGVAASGQPYLMIEYVDGQRIDAYAEAAGLSLEQRVGLVLQVLEAVGHAHANLIVHRDIKPSNILVTADGTVKLLDFGIAKLMAGEEGEERTALTMDGRALTPDYAAPEQVRDEPITTATDVYAVGVLLYLLLSGRHPTRSPGHTPAEAVRGVLEVEPTRLGLGDLDTIIAKAMRKAPAERYQTVGAFAEDLRRYLRQEPVSARPDSLAYRVRKFARRNRAGVAAAATIAVVLVGATGFSVRQMHEARDQRDAAVRSARRALAMSELQRVLAGDTRDMDGQPLTSLSRIALAERVLVRQFHDEPWLVAEVMVDLSGLFYELGDRESERSMLARAAAIAREAGLPEPLALAQCIRASSWWYDDQLDSAQADLAEGRAALAAPSAGGDVLVRAACLEAEGKLLAETGQVDSGVALLRRAAAVAEGAALGSGGVRLVNSLAEVLRLKGRPREAIPHQRRLLEEYEADGYGETEGFPNLVTFLERSLADLGEIRVADSALRAMIRRLEARHGAGRVPTLLAFMYGQQKVRLGELDSAEAWLAPAMRDTTPGAGMLATWLPVVLTELRLEQGRVAEARAAVERVPRRTRGLRATAAMLQARVSRAEGDTAGASARLEAELRALYQESPQRISLFALPLVTAGEWRLAAGDARGADSLARLARQAAALDSLALTRSGLAGRAALLEARAALRLGDTTRAREMVVAAASALQSGYGERHALPAVALRDSLSR